MSIDLSKIAFYKDIDKLEGDLKNRLEQLGLKRTYANTVAPNYDGSYDIDSIGSLTYTGDDSHCKIIRIKDKDGKHPAVNFDTIENKFINSIANTTASKQSIKLMSSTDPHTGIKTYIGVCSIQIPAGSSNIKLKTIDYSPINVQYSFNVNTTANQVYISFSSPKANTTVEIQKIVISYEIKPECVWLDKGAFGMDAADCYQWKDGWKLPDSNYSMVNMKIEESLKDKSVIVSDISDDFLVQDILVNKELANKCINNGIIKNMFVGGNQQQGWLYNIFVSKTPSIIKNKDGEILLQNMLLNGSVYNDSETNILEKWGSAQYIPIIVAQDDIDNKDKQFHYFFENNSNELCIMSNNDGSIKKFPYNKDTDKIVLYSRCAGKLKPTKYFEYGRSINALVKPNDDESKYMVEYYVKDGHDATLTWNDFYQNTKCEIEAPVMRMYEVPLNSTITNYSEIDDSWVEITEISSYYNMFKLIISNKYHNATTIKLQNVGDWAKYGSLEVQIGGATKWIKDDSDIVLLKKGASVDIPSFSYPEVDPSISWYITSSCNKRKEDNHTTATDMYCYASVKKYSDTNTYDGAIEFIAGCHMHLPSGIFWSDVVFPLNCEYRSEDKDRKWADSRYISLLNLREWEDVGVYANIYLLWKAQQYYNTLVLWKKIA